MARDAGMSAGRGSGWLRFGVPAAVSVVLGVVAGIWVSRATAARPGLSVVLGAAADSHRPADRLGGAGRRGHRSRHPRQGRRSAAGLNPPR